MHIPRKKFVKKSSLSLSDCDWNRNFI